MKKKEIKYIIIFILVMFVCTGCGFVFGRFVARAQGKLDFSALADEIRLDVVLIAPIIYVIISALSFIASLVLYLLAYKRASGWDGENEELIEKIEHGLNLSDCIIVVAVIFNMLFFPLCIYSGIIFSEICFLINFTWCIILNALVVGLEKRLNPEKRGSTFQFNFAKKWEDSMDEAEKLIMYKAGYRALRAVNTACLIMWLIACIGMFAFNTGIFAIAVICVIWLVAMLTYIIYDVRYNRG